MTELIKITEHNGENAILARDLHQFLESKQDFSDWIRNRIKQYGFIEYQDFQVFHNSMEKSKQGRPTVEYILSMDMAKELSMVERSERGKQARQYFIEMEKRAYQPKEHIMTLDFEETDTTPYKMQVADMERELRNLISENLYHGDQLKIARKCNVTHSFVRNVLYGSHKSERVFMALYEKALFNKEQKVRDLRLMIDSLK